MIKCLSIQIDLSRDASFDADDMRRALKQLGRYPEVDRDPETPGLVQFNLFSENVDALWAQLKDKLFSNGPLALWLDKVAIVVCDGEQDRDDGLLLWHFDKSSR